MTEPSPDPFRDFDERLKAARTSRDNPDAEDEVRPSKFGPGLQAGIEVVGGTIGGVLIGWALDSWFGTMPILLVVFFLLGGIAGVRNAFRTLKRLVPEEDER